VSVVYVKPDGTRTGDRSWAHHVAPVDVVNAWRNVSSRIPARFAVGSALHESGYAVNEIDAGDQGDGSDSIGIFQLSKAEASDAGHPLADLTDLDQAATVFAITMHKKLDAIVKATNDGNDLYDDDDLWAFLQIAHNQGLGAALATIKAHGANYSGPGGYRERNIGINKPGFNGPHIIAYADDVISGGHDWDPSWDALPAPPPSVDAKDPRDTALNIVLLVGVGLAALWALSRLA
jgi:hypothetical protein